MIERAPVQFIPARGRPRRRFRPVDGTLVLTVDELVVLKGDGARPSDILMRQGRADLAMARRPAGRGGEHVELAALDGQEATLRFDRRHVRAAEAIADWLAGLHA